MPGHPQGITDRLDPRPFLLESEVARDPGEEIRPLIEPAVCGLARLVVAVTEVLQVALQVLAEVRLDPLPERRLVVLDADHEVAAALDDAARDLLLAAH